MRKKNELPEKNNKVRRAIWIFLASIGIASSMPNSVVSAKNQNINVEEDDTKHVKSKESNKKAFFDDLKVDTPISRVVDYKEMAVDVVKEKGFNANYGGNEVAQKKVMKLFEKIDENTPRYASLHGISNTKEYTENFKKLMYTQLKDWVKDIMLVPKYDKNDPNCKKLGLMTSGFTNHKTHEITLKEYESKKATSHLTLAHEMGHTTQISSMSHKYLPNYSKLYKRLKEGLSVDFKKRCSDINEPETEYTKDYIMYSICGFFTNGKVEGWEQGKYESTNLYKILKESLDEKYGKKTAAKLYTMLANMSRFGTQYGKNESLEENKEKQSNIEKRIQEIREDEELTESEKNETIENLNIMLEMNKDYYKNLEEKGNKPNKNGESILNLEMKELSEFALGLLEKDFNKITTKEEAKKELIKWNEYKATCMVKKNGMREETDSEIDIKDALPKAKKVQDLLFEKCKEVKLLNENIDKGIFTAVLDSNINDISNVAIVKQKNKLIVMDQYAINALRGKNDNSCIVKESGKKSEKTDKINNSENQFTSYELESVGNYTKEFAQDIKGKRISLIEQEKETSLEH